MKISNYLTACLTAFLLCISSAALGQETTESGEPAETPEVVDPGPEDALGRGNPHDSIVAYLKTSAEFNWAKAAEYLDLRNLPEDVAEIGGPELARQFSHVLSRSIWFDDYSMSSSGEGLKGDGLSEYRDELLKIPTSDGSVTIWMQRVPRGDGENIWKISNRSVVLIPELYDEYSYPGPIEKIRAWFPEDAAFLGFELFKWVIILAAALVSWPIFRLLGIGLSRLFSSPEKEIYPLVRKIFTGPFVLVGIMVLFYFIISKLGVGAYGQQVMRAQTITTIAVVWVVWAIINLIKKHQQDKLTAAGRPGAARLMQPITTLFKVLVLIFGLLFWLNNIGVNITTVLAGLGVGGLAVALALQKPIEDMMGALSIFSQAHVRVGDLIRYEQETGTVEDIGLRTTLIRTLTNTVVSIPNSLVAAAKIENLSYRQMIRYWPTLRLRYDTTPEQLKKVLDGAQAMLEQDDRIHDEPVRVCFTDLDSDALLVKLHCFVKTADFTEFLEIAQDLNFRVMEIVRDSGARFALPGRALYMEAEPSSTSANV